jgi:signal transduction histidine kinase
MDGRVMDTTHDTLTERLRAIPDLRQLPPEELEWLATHGRIEVYEPGFMYRPGQDARDLIIILSGHIAVRMDRGLGPRQVAEWSDGQITGRLPFSRMARVESTILTDVRTEAFALDREHFPELIHRCPNFTALTVHTMIDRARGFKASDLQDEKTLSLGRLAAGLAHELNNPASATMRGAKSIRAGLPEAERASRALCRAGLSEDQIDRLETISSEWLGRSHSTHSLDRTDEIADWLAKHRLGSDTSEALADLGMETHQLDELAIAVPSEALGAVLDWLVAGQATRDTALDIERAARRISDLVAAMKRFTHMDRVSEPGPVNVEAGLRDTVEVMQSRARANGVSITLSAEAALPNVHAVGSELNQVWANVIENAIDAASDGGDVEITLEKEPHHVVVRVIDNGPGIKPEILSRIFDPFFTTKPPGQGVGLGLEIARQLLRRNGGEIGVRSAPGRTEFAVRLPVERTPDVRSP